VSDCKVCGEKVQTRNGKVDDHCSRACRKITNNATLKCAVCDVIYTLHNSKAKKSKTCSKICNSVLTLSMTREAYVEQVDLAKTGCVICSGSVRLRGGIAAKYCSRKCRGLDGYVELQCRHCEEKFMVQSWLLQSAHTGQYCSTKCSGLARSGDKSANYIPSGRVICEVTGCWKIRVSGDVWRHEHRILVERHIGRKLEYQSEPILHINGIKTDNDFSNLYVCLNRSEMMTIIMSSDTPYPVKSNVEDLVKKESS
jgi:hypothetical protein